MEQENKTSFSQKCNNVLKTSLDSLKTIKEILLIMISISALFLTDLPNQISQSLGQYSASTVGVEQLNNQPDEMSIDNEDDNHDEHFEEHSDDRAEFENDEDSDRQSGNFEQVDNMEDIYHEDDLELENHIVEPVQDQEYELELEQNSFNDQIHEDVELDRRNIDTVQRHRDGRQRVQNNNRLTPRPRY